VSMGWVNFACWFCFGCGVVVGAFVAIIALGLYLDWRQK
jgi:hypothetical protein